jgi:integrase
MKRSRDPNSRPTLPGILSAAEITRIRTNNLKHWTILATFYATALRANELRHLKVSDLDSHRMVWHVRLGQGGVPRDIALSPILRERLQARDDRTLEVVRKGEQLFFKDWVAFSWRIIPSLRFVRKSPMRLTDGRCCIFRERSAHGGWSTIPLTTSSSTLGVGSRNAPS